MSIPRTFTATTLPLRVRFGPGVARLALGEELDRLSSRRALVICGGAEASLARELVAPLGDRVAGLFGGAEPHVPVAVAAEARAVAAELEADALVAIGGGSTTGTAKAVALTTGLPVLAVPTTYAGSEVTPVWGLTEDGRKKTGTDQRVMPRTVLYDPELTLTLPVELSVASGLNALAHCVEAFWAPGANPVASVLAEAGIQALASGLVIVAADPGDLGGRSDLLEGAWLAGTAFAAAGSGLHHKLCHALGGQFDLPHAQTHAVVLPHVVSVMAPAVPGTGERILRALSVPTGTSPAAAVWDLGERLGAPRSLAGLGFPAGGIIPVVEQVLETVPQEPRRLTDADVRGVLEAACAGARP